jgi:hypothetical protein
VVNNRKNLLIKPRKFYKILMLEITNERKLI